MNPPVKYFLYAIERHEDSPRYQDNLYPEENWPMVLNLMANDFVNQPWVVSLWLKADNEDSVLLWRRK